MSDRVIRPKRSLLHRYPDLWVLTGFLLLNAVLTTPFFLFNRADWRILPLPGVDLRTWQDLFVTRDHVDLLRINAELSLALAAWVVLAPRWGPKARTWFWRFFISLYIPALVYWTYAGALSGLYQMQPNFYNDYGFLIGGLPFFFSAMSLPWWVYPAAGLGLPALVGLLWWGTRKLLVDLKVSELGGYNRGLLVLIGLLVLVFGWRYRGAWSDPELVVSSLGANLVENVRASLASRRTVEEFDVWSPFHTYDYAQYGLGAKPDIYLIFMESYGSVLYTKDHFRGPYLEALGELEDQVEAEGWVSTSIFSEAPTWGGGTWISYTSAMFGLPLREQSQYAALHTAYQQIPYPNLGRYLHSQGYEYVWVSPIQRRISPEREAADRNFFGVDRWVTLESMDYQGPLYGWGPSPPDQFTFGTIGDFVRTRQQPTFLVFLTQNAHYPYTPLPPFEGDWRVFGDPGSMGRFPIEVTENEPVFRSTRQHYLDAITYTLQVLGEFITQIEDPNAVIILLGDHQPPAVSYKGDGYATITHILSRDEAFLDGFQDYGFTPGMILALPEGSQAEAGMVHAGFYSLFVRNLMARYGEAGSDLPDYLPEGLK